MSSFFSGFTVTGAGEDRPEEIIPIDIQYQKIVEWLIDRKKCPQNWKKIIEPHRKTRKEVIEKVDLDALQLSDLKLNDPDESTSYFDLELVFEKLKLDEKNQPKDFMGYYTQPLMKEVDGALTQSKQQNLHLIDAASHLSKMVQYDVPATRSQITRFSKMISETNRKIAEHERNEAKYLSGFKDLCASWNIEGKNVREELSLVTGRDLPKFFEQISKEAADKQQTIKEAIEFYSTFIRYVTQTTETETQEDSEQQKRQEQVCALTSFWAQRGDCLVKDWEHYLQTGEFAAAEEEAEQFISLEVAGDGDGEQMIGIGEEFQISVDASDETPIEIDFSAGFSADAGEEISVDFGGDWDIGVQEEGGDAPAINWGDAFEVVDAAEVGVGDDYTGAGDSSSPSSNPSILECGDTRKKLLSDLMELEIFFTQRLLEMKGKSTLLSSNQFQFAPALIQNQTVSSVEGYLECVQSILSQFNAERIKLLLEMKSSRHFVERTSLSIRQKEDAASKLQMAALELTAKREGYAASIAELRPIADRAVVRAKQIQKGLERELSLLVNRPVNIIGDINNL